MTEHLRLLVELFAAVVGGGLGGWVLRWGQHRDDCRALEHDAELDGYDRGWADCDRRRHVLEQMDQAQAAELVRDHLASVVLEESAGEEYAATRTIYHELEPGVLGSDNVSRPVESQQLSDGPGHPDEAGDDTLTRLYHRDGTWEQDQRSIGATGQSLWFLAWQQRQAVA